MENITKIFINKVDCIGPNAAEGQVTKKSDSQQFYKYSLPTPSLPLKTTFVAKFALFNIL